MNIIQRMKVTMMRQLGKTVTLLVIIFIIGVVISGAISVQNAVLGLDANMRQNMKPIISFDINLEMSEAHWEKLGELPLEGFLTADIVKKIAALPYVESFFYSVNIQALSRDLMEYFYGRDVDTHPPDAQEGITLYGTSTSELVQVTEGLIEITQGRTFLNSEIDQLSMVSPIIISEGFADLNQLSIGSTFVLDIEISEIDPDEDIFDPHWIPKEMPIIANETFEFEVVGMFDIVNQESFENSDLHESEREMLLSRERDRVSQLLEMVHVPNNVAEVMQQFEAEHRLEVLQDPDSLAFMSQDSYENRVSAMMLLHDPLDMDAFIEAAEPLLPSEFWQVSYITNDFDHVATAMENMKHVAQWLLFGSIGAAILILGLLVSLFLHDRKREIGIYLALGEKRFKIVLQILAEIVTVTFVAMSLALFIGNQVSNMISREMLRTEVLMPRECEYNGNLMRMGFMQSAPDIYPKELMEIFDVSLDAGAIIIFYTIGLGTVILSTVVPIINVTKLNPKTVLM